MGALGGGSCGYEEDGGRKGGQKRDWTQKE